MLFGNNARNVFGRNTNPYQAHAVTPKAVARASNPDNCWWTETGWHCCTSSNSSWPSCIAGGLTTQQRGYGPRPPNGSYAAAVAAGAVAPARMLANGTNTNLILQTIAARRRRRSI